MRIRKRGNLGYIEYVKVKDKWIKVDEEGEVKVVDIKEIAEAIKGGVKTVEPEEVIYS